MSVDTYGNTKSPETFPGAKLLAQDFDNTIALSFESSPNGVGINEAHELAIEEMFGVEARDDFVRNGGLDNRAPVEVVKDTVPDASSSELKALTKQFIATKLNVLMGEVGERFPDGSIWPRPTPGYLDLLEFLETARSDGRLIDDLVLSSGHEPFIHKVYQVWGARQPDHLIATETVDRLSINLPTKQLVKPSTLLMTLAINTWRKSFGLVETAQPRVEDLGRVLYVGDDERRDGELARNSKVEFFLFDPHYSVEIWRSIATRLGLGRVGLSGVVE